MNMWTKADWRKKPRVQMPDYKNIKILKDVENQLEKYPPLVFAGEARKLKQQLGKVANGQGFLLQGGDCAESFAEFSADNIEASFHDYLESQELSLGKLMPMLRISVTGRLAGPSMFSTLELLGKEEVSSRIHRAAKSIQNG